MRTDLLEAQAAVDWVYDQLPSLKERLDAWLEGNMTIEIRDLPPPATHDPVVAVEKELLPIAFSVEVGAYINTIRSSLDILATALVHRHELQIREERICFPFASSEAALMKRDASPLLERLPQDDRGRLLALKPYRGGNNNLWALHHLDILRKHRRLLDVQIRPIQLFMKGLPDPDDFQVVRGGPFQAGSETVIGLLRKGIRRPEMQSRFYVALCEPDTIQRRPALATLSHLAQIAAGVIKLFDV